MCTNYSRIFHRIFLHIFGILFILILFPGCTQEKIENKTADLATPVIVKEITTRTVEYALEQVGTLQSKQEVTIRSEIQGRVTEILFNEGKAITQNDTLVKLDDALVRADIRNFEARIKQLKIRLENKKRTIDRELPLAKQNLVSRLHLDNLQTEIKEIETQIIQTQENLARQKELFSYTVIQAPFSGIAGERMFSRGHYLRVGDQVVTIIDLDPLEISFYVPEKFKSKLFIDQSIQLTVDAYADRVFEGSIFFISPQVDSKTRTFQAKATVQNSNFLLNPGMFAHVEIITDVHTNALTVPWESIIQTEEETYIYALEEEVARKVLVRLGKITSKWAEILDTTLAPNTMIITEGKFAVKDGAKVTVKQSQES